MLKLIDSSSIKTVLPELDLISIPPTQVAVLNTRWVEINLKNTLLPRGPWEFTLANNNKSYLNLKTAQLVVTFRILSGDGTAIPEKDDDGKTNPLYAPCQSFATSLVRQWTMSINNKLVYDSTVNHAYKTYMENVLTYGRERKSTIMSGEGYFYETALNDEASESFKSRFKLVKNGQSCQLSAPISLDLFNQDRVLLNYANVELVAYPNPDNFLIDAYQVNDDFDIKVAIDKVHIEVEQWDVSDGYTLEIEKALTQDKIHYPVTSVHMRSFFIPENRMDSPVNTLFTSHIPKRLIVGLVDSDSYNGKMTKTPFNFQHFNLTNCYVEYSGHTVPTHPMQLDYKNNKFSYAYQQMINGLGLQRSDADNGITMDMFKNGFNFYVFKLSPTATTDGVMDMMRQSNLSVRLEFSEKIPAGGVYAIILGEFDTLISFDKERNVYFDSVV